MEAETDQCLVGATLLHLIDANQNKKIMVQYVLSVLSKGESFQSVIAYDRTNKYEELHQGVCRGNYEGNDNLISTCLKN